MRKRICFDYGFCFLTALLLLTLPLHWVAAYFLAAFFHELGHYLAILLLGGKISCLEFSFRGARMYASALPPKRELVCLLTGPAASLSMLLFVRIFPQLSLCGLVQGIYNLLPIGNLDGGKAARIICLLRRERYFRGRRKKPLQSGATNSTMGALCSKR